MINPSLFCSPYRIFAIFFAVCILGSFLLFAADQIDNDNSASGFGGGTHSDTQWDSGNNWLELDATGQSDGTGDFISRVLDAGLSASWTTLTWTPQRPLYKELPDNATTETGYSAGNADMTGNVLLLHMDESSGTIADTSGNNNNGTATSVTYGATGKINTALTFNGNDSIVSVTDHSTLDITSAITLEAWVYPTSYDDWDRIVAKHHTSDVAPWVIYDLQLGDDSDDNSNSEEPYACVAIGGTSYCVEALSATPLNTWTHIVGTYDGATLAIYVNGALSNSTPQTGSIDTNNRPVTIGKNEWHTYGTFIGSIDEVAVFNRALSATEIADHYKRGAVRLKYQARSCNDAACSGESFVGPAGTTSDYYSELSNATTSTPSLSLTNFGGDNRYFQYRAYLETDNASFSPELKSVTIGPAHTSDQTITIGDVSVSESAGTATVTVSMASTGDASTTVDYATSNGTAASGSDYTSASGTLTWTAGQTGDKTFTVTITNDTADEDDETITVTLSNAVNGTISDASGVVTITDNDDAPTVSINDVSAAESAGTASFTVSLSAASGKAITVDYATANGTATAGSDYTSASGTLSFAAGETSKSASVTITNDALDENDETYTVGLSNAVNASILDSSGAGTITDNDGLPSVAFTASSQSSAGESGTMTVTAQLSATSGLDVTVPYTLSGTATGSGTDYNITASPVTITAGSTTAAVTITVAGDSLDENDETVIVTMGSPTNASQGATTVHTATITDDDDPPTVTLSASVSSIAENAGTTTVTATLSAVSAKAVTVNLTASGTATATDDYTLAGSISISAGSTSGTATLTAVDDSIDEIEETVIVDVSSITNGTESGTQQATVTITDDDTAGVTVTPSGGSTNVTEGNPATDSYTVVLNTQPTSDVTVTLTPDAQLSLNSQTLTFTAGNWNTARTITVTAVDDSVDEESVHTGAITHSSASSDSFYQGVSVSSVTVSVTDNDTAAVSVTETGGSTDVTEGGATDTFTVVLTTRPTSDVTVTLTPDEQTNPDRETLVFTSSSWNTAQTVTVMAEDDDKAEGTHSGNIVNTTQSSDRYYDDLDVLGVTAVVTDNDSAGVSITQSEGTTQVTEGGWISEGTTDTYTIVLTSEPTDIVTVSVNPDAELTAEPAVRTFVPSAWNTEQTVEVGAVADDVEEGNHSGTVLHSVASVDARYNEIEVSGITVEIGDSEDGEVNASAGFDSTVLAGRSVTLDGSGSTGSGLAYSWVILSGEGVLTGETSVAPAYTAPDHAGTAIVELTVTDDQGATSTDTVTLFIVNQEEISGEILDVPLVGRVGGYAVFETRGENGEPVLEIGDMEIHLPQEECENYSLVMTGAGYLVIGCPEASGAQGWVYVSHDPLLPAVAVNIVLEPEAIVEAVTTDGDYGPNPAVSGIEESFTRLSGNQAGSAFGRYLAVGDVNEDGEDDILIGAPGVGSNGVVYVYSTDLVLTGTIFGSGDYPVRSVLAGDYLGNTTHDIFFGPDNEALNTNLSWQKALTADEEMGEGFFISGRATLAGNIDLALTSADAWVGDGAVYQSAAFGDANGDGENDLVLGGVNGNAYVFFGRLEETDNITAGEADVVITAGDTEDDFGRMVAVGDVSGDGVGDIIIGAPDHGADRSGVVYVLFGSRALGGEVDLSDGSSSVQLGGSSADDRIGSDLLLADSDGNGSHEIYTLNILDEVYKFDLASSEEEDSSGGIGGGSAAGSNVFGCRLRSTGYSAFPGFGLVVIVLLLAITRLKRIFFIFAFLTLTFTAGAVSASTDRFSLLSVRPATGSGDFVVTYGSNQLVARQWRVSTWSGYGYHPVEITSGGSRVRGVVDHLLVWYMEGSYAPWNRWEFGLNVPLVYLNSPTNPVVPAVPAGNEVDPGDIAIKSRFGISDRETNPLGLAIVAHLTVPTGNDRHFAGDTLPTLGAAAVLDANWGKSVALGTNVGFDAGQEIVWEDLDTGTRLKLSAAIAVKVSEKLTFKGDVYGATPLMKPFKNKVSTPSEAFFGIQQNIGASGFSANLSGGISLVRAAGVPLFRTMAGISYTGKK